LAHHDVFGTTGIDPFHIRFCRKRPEKADRCAELEVTHFVDDRTDVIEHLLGVVEHRFLFGGRSVEVPESAEWVRDWAEAEARIRASLICS
jgi:hypothetical protein